MRAVDASRSGFTLIELIVVITIIALIAVIAIPNYLTQRKNASELAAFSALRTCVQEQQIFHDADKENDGNTDFGMLSELSNTGLVDVILGTGTRSGYYFQVGYSATSSNFLWFGVANPATKQGDRAYAVNQNGVIYYTTTFPITPDYQSCTIPSGYVQMGR